MTEVIGFETEKLPSLQTLELRGNQLSSTKGIRLATLKNLFIVRILIKYFQIFPYITKNKSIHPAMTETRRNTLLPDILLNKNLISANLKI